MIPPIASRLRGGRLLPVVQAGAIAAFLLLVLAGAPQPVQYAADRVSLLLLQAVLLIQLQELQGQEGAPDRWLWRMLVVATALWMVAAAHELVVVLVIGQGPPVPSLAHLLLLAGLSAAATGVSLYPVSEGKQIGRLRDLFDVALLMVGSLILFWMVVVRPTIDTGIGSPIAIAWLAVAPAFDLALSLLLVRLLLVSRSRVERIVLLLLTAAFLARLPSDVALAYKHLLADDAISPGWNLGWLLAPAILSQAARVRSRSTSPHGEPAAWSRWSRLAAKTEPMLPAIMTTMIAGFTLIEWWLLGVVDWLGVAAAGMMLVLMVARQGVIAGQAEMRQHAALLHAAADLAFVCDADGRIVLANPAMRTAVGLSDEREPTPMLQDVMPPDQAVGALADALAGGWSGEVLFWDGQGEPFPVALSLRPLMDERQTEPLVAGTAHDLTELKQREADLQSALGEVAEARRQLQVLNTNLESTVHSRTAELADTVKQLERMNEELKELDDLKSEFVTLVSHELRGPLTNIRSGVELALRRSEHLPESAEETLELVSAETERLASFVEIILDLSALEAGRFPLELERIPVPVICRAVVSRIPPESGSQRIRLAMEDSLPVVSADERSLTSVLFHLLDNALKYAPDGLVTLGAACDAGMLKVTVADAGPGIAPEAREAVFERFRRLDTRDSRETYGHGLGLYLSRRLVEAMGGRIKAGESAAGGAELTFWLPLADA